VYSRRKFLECGVTAAAATIASSAIGSVTPRPLLAQLGGKPEPVPPIQDPRLQKLVQRAIEAATAAGATYADVRLVHTRVRLITVNASNFEWMTVGVRALVNGFWGFAASPVWSFEEMARLGTAAVAQARAAAMDKTRPMTLAPLPQVANGHWDMPIEIDPFTVPVDEVVDYKSSIQLYAAKLAAARGYRFSAQNAQCMFVAQEKAFGSSEGSYCTQRLYRSSGGYSWELGNGTDTVPLGAMDYLSIAGVGWELYRGQPLRDYTDLVIEEGIEDLSLPKKPVEVGRYETVWDASSVAHLASATLGLATEADRVFGYEANATGTSYITDPLQMLGSYPIGSQLLNVTANRTEPGGVMTVKWDDEGVAPEEFTLVKNGVLTDLSTTRESAGWLSDYYKKAGVSPNSHGCALGAQDIVGRGMNLPLSSTPNLKIMPGSAEQNFDSSVAGMSKGLAFRRIKFDMDFQQSNGLGVPERVYEVRNGKRVATIQGAGILFRSTDLWKSLIALGGTSAARRFGMFEMKGQPPQWPYHSVTAVPAVFKDITVVDASRKA
jgi:TldD protein